MSFPCSAYTFNNNFPLPPQVALAAAQEEAAATAAHAAEAQSRADALSHRLQQEQQQRKAGFSTTAFDQARQNIKSRDQGHKRLTTVELEDLDVSSLIQKLRAQQAEIAGLQNALEASNKKWAQEAAVSDQAKTELLESEKRARDLQTQVVSLEQEVGHLLEQQQSLHISLQQARQRSAHDPAVMTEGGVLGQLKPSSGGTTSSSVGACLGQVDAAATTWREIFATQQERISELESAVIMTCHRLEDTEAQLVAAEVQVSSMVTWYIAALFPLCLCKMDWTDTKKEQHCACVGLEFFTCVCMLKTHKMVLFAAS